MLLILEIEPIELAHAIIEDAPCAKQNRDETHAVLNAIRRSVRNLGEVDKETLCQIILQYYGDNFTPENLTIENIGELNENTSTEV